MRTKYNAPAWPSKAHNSIDAYGRHPRHEPVAATVCCA